MDTLEIADQLRLAGVSDGATDDHHSFDQNLLELRIASLPELELVVHDIEAQTPQRFHETLEVEQRRRGLSIDGVGAGRAIQEREPIRIDEERSFEDQHRP